MLNSVSKLLTPSQSLLLAVVKPKVFDLKPPSVSKYPAKKCFFISCDDFSIEVGTKTLLLFAPFGISIRSLKNLNNSLFLILKYKRGILFPLLRGSLGLVLVNIRV